MLSRLLHLYGFGFPVVLLGLLLLAGWLLWSALRRRGVASPLGALPAGTWLLFLWSALTAVFYVANHTFVQTRYLFVTAPLLTIALLALFAVRWLAAFRCLLVFALLYGVAMSVLATRPLVRNKVRLDAVWVELAAELHTLPPDAPIATYSIGEIGFLGEHPLVDTGGITRPGAVAYLWDATEDRRTAWIYSQGAQYEIVDHPPLPGATLVWARPIPLTGWYFHPAMYRRTETIQLWKLPPPR